MKCKWGIMIFMIMLFLMGCTDRINSVGYNTVGEPQYLKTGTANISKVYSYEDSVNHYVNSSKLTIGNRGIYETMLLLDIVSLPDSVAEIEESELILSLVVSKQTGSESGIYNYGRVLQTWDEDEVSYKTATDSTDWESHFVEEYGSFDISGEYSNYDTLEISLPLELFYHLERGIFQADTLAVNYGIYIQRADPDQSSSDFIEYYSYENDAALQPKLNFNYKNNLEDSVYTEWVSSTINDANLFSCVGGDNSSLEYYEVYDDELLLQNISPVKMYLEISLGLADFADSLGNVVIDSFQYNNMTINRAFLVLHAKEDYYSSNNYIYTQPALLKHSVFPADNEIPVYEDDYELVSGVKITQDSLSSVGDDLIYKIGITKELQAITTTNDGLSGVGLVIRSLRENRDFSYVKFYSSTEDIEKGPFLEIYYTLPLEP
ncbi:MAG: hypothetical protein K9M99_00685 [Candidatus Cloacimonetes bacterium]|nr:hypothetical protein [Candidatus Cloacimonadota bacterium]